MKKLALFDFDNVIYDGHSVFDIIQSQEKDGFIRIGIWDEINKLLIGYKNKELTYKEAADKMLAVWANSLTGKMYEEVISYVSDYLNDNAKKLLPWFEQTLPLLKKQHEIFIVSTNFQFITEVIVRKFGLSGHISSTAEIVQDKFTGKVSKSLAGNKGEVVSLMKKYSKEGSIAVGDSENDIDMLEQFEIQLCFNPDEKLNEAAQKNGWMIVNESSIASVLSKALA